jgi:hypothetical protein
LKGHGFSRGGNARPLFRASLAQLHESAVAPPLGHLQRKHKAARGNAHERHDQRETAGVGAGAGAFGFLPFAGTVLSLCQPQHGVSDDAGDRDIKPKRKSPARDPAMLREAPGERKEERDQHHGQRHNSQDDVACQQRQVERAQRCMGGVPDVSVQRVVNDVAHQKERGEDERRDHQGAVSGNFARADESVADEQRHGGEAIEDGVQPGQKDEARIAGIRCWMHVDEPEEKQCGGCADCKNGGDGRARACGERDGGGHWNRRTPEVSL